MPPNMYCIYLLYINEAEKLKNLLFSLSSGLYQDFENLTTEEQYQIFGAAAAAAQANQQGQNQDRQSQQDRRQQEEQELEDIDETLNIVPDVIESDIRHPMPPGIIKKKNSSVSSGSGDEQVPESRSRRIR